MTFWIFCLLLACAITGLIMPYIRGFTRTHFAIGAAVSLTGIIGSAPQHPRGADFEPTTITVATTEGTPTANALPTAMPPLSHWHYRTSEDRMRGTVTRFAGVSSENLVNLDFPYGETNGKIIVRKSPEDGTNILFSVSSGQIRCRGSNDNFISVKFDNRPVREFPCIGAADGSSDVAFIENEASFLKALKASEITIIEAEFYRRGRQQFTFKTAGLEWD